VEASGGRVGLRRLSVGAVLCVVVWAVAAQPAEAHGALPHYATVITSVEPAVPGVHIEAAPDGRYLSITNPTSSWPPAAGRPPTRVEPRGCDLTPSAVAARQDTCSSSRRCAGMREVTGFGCRIRSGGRTPSTSDAEDRRERQS
jgi:hypothetical protein